MSLTGRPDGPPLGAPSAVPDHLTRLAERLAKLTAELGTPVLVDGPALLGERAAVAGLQRQGATSCGGTTRLLRAADGWVAVCLARRTDLELLPAWLGLPPVGDAADPWPSVTTALASRSAALVVGAAIELGLAAARLGETAVGPPLLAERRGDRPPPPTIHGLRVVDLSALWAGPLCGQLLALAGMDVVKVESAERPDGGRAGLPTFFDLLNGPKSSVCLPFRQREGVEALRRLVASADVVIEASRPRALVQLGVDAAALQRTGRPQVWVSLTGHGARDEAARRVGFGDDAAVAGGLVAHDRDGPVFLADAIADPSTGLLAAVAVLDRLRPGGIWHLDVALTRTAAWMAGGEVTHWARPVAPPRAREPVRPAAPLGHDNRRVLGALEGGG
jgi:hypothetical protein